MVELTDVRDGRSENIGWSGHAYMIPWIGKVYDLRCDYYVELKRQNKKGNGLQTSNQLDDTRTKKDIVKRGRQT